MARVIQLKLDIKFNDDNLSGLNELYSAIAEHIKDAHRCGADIELKDDGNAPYYEDITEQYKKFEQGNKL